MKNKDLKLIVENEALRIVQEIMGLKNNIVDVTHPEEKAQKLAAQGIRNRGVISNKEKKSGEKDNDKLNQQNQKDEADEESSQTKKPKDSAGEREDKNNDEQTKSGEKDKSGGKGTKDSPKLTPPISSLMNPNFDDILDAIALIRGGKSAKKNSEIRKALRGYFDELTSAERRTLNAFLLGSAQVLSDYDTDDAVEPDDVGVEIVSTKEVGDAKKSQNQPPDRSTKVSLAKKSSDSPPVIVVGERANKDREMMILASYRRS